MADIKIYIATHRHAPKGLFDAGYIAIQGGRHGSQIDLGLNGDDTGDNISDLNPYFNECTVLYWALKNGDSKFMGLVHYRRYFSARHIAVRVDDYLVARSIDFIEVTSGDLDIVTAAPFRYVDAQGRAISLEENYYGAHVGWDLLLVREAIGKLSASYLQAFDAVMRGNNFIPYNMFFAKTVLIREYGEWLFPILFELDKTVPYRFYDTIYQQRAIAFISERLFNVWLAKNRSKIKAGYRSVVFFDNLKESAA